MVQKNIVPNCISHHCIAHHPTLCLGLRRGFHVTDAHLFLLQVNITQDSLQSFLKVADKLKIKGLCERAMIAPEPPLQHATITLPIKDEKKTTNAASLAHTNFDSLLGRTNYMGEPPAQQLSPGQVVSLAQPSLPPLRHSVTSSAPPAHQVEPPRSHGTMMMCAYYIK